jgi:hypothetical protein
VRVNSVIPITRQEGGFSRNYVEHDTVTEISDDKIIELPSPGIIKVLNQETGRNYKIDYLVVKFLKTVSSGQEFH